MATTTRLLRTTCSRTFTPPPHSFIQSTGSCRASLSGDTTSDNNIIIISDNNKKKKGEIKIISTRNPVVLVQALKASSIATITTSTNHTSQPMLNLAAIIMATIRNATLLPLKDIVAVKRRRKRNLQPQMLIERAIVDCRFFTLFAVAGSLLGSVLCFFEGCLLVIESYAHYFHMLSQRLDQGHLVHLLIEAIDMFMVGTALVIFGVSLYVMFVGSRVASKEKEPWVCDSNLFGLFYMKSAPRWVGMQSIEQAKSKIGHAVMMILQVGLIEKFKDIPLVTGVDLACFAAAVLTSSATIFLLSKIHRY